MERAGVSSLDMTDVSIVVTNTNYALANQPIYPFVSEGAAGFYSSKGNAWFEVSWVVFVAV